MAVPPDSVYRAALQSFTVTHPRVGAVLLAAEETRAERLTLMAGGQRLKGLEEFVTRLETVVSAWNEDESLGRLAFMVKRAQADFEIAIEASLSGYPATASDAMRDVLEIEMLLLDFYLEPTRVDEWLNAERDVRLNRYSPAAVRKRVLESGLHEVATSPTVAADYRSHSEALHVVPNWPPVAELRRGHVAAARDSYFAVDVGFIEMYEHGRRLGNAVLLIAHRLSPDSPAEEESSGELPEFSEGHARTQEYLREWLDLLAKVRSG